MSDDNRDDRIFSVRWGNRFDCAGGDPVTALQLTIEQLRDPTYDAGGMYFEVAEVPDWSHTVPDENYTTYDARTMKKVNDGDAKYG